MKPLLPALLLLGALAAPSLGEETAAIDIVRNPSAYSGRFVTVRGVMTNVRPEIAGGIQRTTGTLFNLTAGPAILVVRSTVPPGCSTGSTVTVDGRFVPMAQIRQQLYTNLIEATVVACR